MARTFVGHIIFTLKETAKFMLLTFGVFFIVGMPLAGIFYILKVDVEIAGIITGILITILVIFIDSKKTHCLRNIHDDRLDVMKDFLKEKI